MRNIFFITGGLMLLGLSGCQSSTDTAAETEKSSEPEWTTLFDGTSLDGWTMAGDANWMLADGAVQATSGTGFLVSQDPYTDFELNVEFWTDAPANSGVFLRCSDTSMITAENAYEVNIFDARPDPTYRTGAVVNVAPPAVQINAAGQWNTYDIRAEGDHLVVMLNGMQTVDVHDTKHATGPIGLQYGAGTVKFRSVKIRQL